MSSDIVTDPRSNVVIPEDIFQQDLEDLKKLEDEANSLTEEQYKDSVQDLWQDWGAQVDQEDKFSSVESAIDDLKVMITAVKISNEESVEEIKDTLKSVLTELKKINEKLQ